MRRFAPLLALLFACHAPLAPEPRDSLVGLSLPIVAEGAIALELPGAVGQQPATIGISLTQPLATVTEGCFPQGDPASDRQVRVRQVEGGERVYPEIALRGARLGPKRLGTIDAGLVAGKDCRVELGTDALQGVALRISVARRTVTFERPKTREAYLGEAGPDADVAALELSRDPQNDWPLLPVELVQRKQRLVGAFVLATLSTMTHVSAPAAQQAGVLPAMARLRSLKLPFQLPQAPGVGERLAIADSVALAPGLSVGETGVLVDPDWKRVSPLGLLGSDVWGKFDLVIDLPGHLLVVSRPRRTGEGGRQRCASAGGSSEQGCFVLSQLAWPRRAGVAVTVWRDLAQGGRVYVDPLDAKGNPVQGRCRFGFSFAPTSGGASLAEPIPWDGLLKALPGCEAVSRAAKFRIGFFDDGPMPHCPGDCAFAVDLGARQVACACPQKDESRLASLEALLRQLQPVLERPPPSVQEPDEPDDVP